MKKLLTAILLAPLAYGSLKAIDPPPSYYLPQPFAAANPSELFDKLAKIDTQLYCAFTDDEQSLQLQKKNFLSSRESFVEWIDCYARTLSGDEVADLVNVAQNAATWDVADLPKEVLQHLYTMAESFISQDDGQYAFGAQKLLMKARDLAKEKDLDTAVLERKFIEGGYRTLSIFSDLYDAQVRRYSLEFLDAVANENKIPVAQHHQAAGEALRKEILEHLIYATHPDSALSWAMKYPELSITHTPYLEAFRFADELLVTRPSNVQILDAAINRAKAYLPHAKYPQMRATTIEALDLAAIISADLPKKQHEKYDKTLQGLRELLNKGR